MKNIKICLGAGFGDEGKGATVNSLISHPNNTVVVRFNGGHQVGHTVVHNNIKHPFSNFGSGTLKGVPTYWSEFCTVNPMAVLKEGNILRNYGLKPELILNYNTMVTTPYDIYENIRDNQNLNHGSVGVGFGKTIQRNADNYHLYVRDLQYSKIRDEKLKLIAGYYGFDINHPSIKSTVDEFKSACDDLINRYAIINDLNYLHFYDNFIFEGGQGILLDMDYGFFPNVTRSNTTSKNAFELIKQLKNLDGFINTYYITRAYQTRHGNGYMSNEDLDSSFIKTNPDETNKNDGHQGIFRKTVLDIDLLDYAIVCDKLHNQSHKYNLVITCLDQVPQKFPVTNNNILIDCDYNKIGNLLGFTKKQIFTSYSDKGIADIK